MAIRENDCINAGSGAPLSTAILNRAEEQNFRRAGDHEKDRDFKIIPIHEYLNSAPEVLASFPIEALPPVIKDCVTHVWNKLQAPVPLIFGSVITQVAACCQHFANVQIPGGPTMPISIFTMVLAESGERKTAVDSMVGEQMQASETKNYARYQDQVISYQTALQAWTELNRLAKRARTSKSIDDLTQQKLEEEFNQIQGRKPKPPKHVQLIYKDATVEAIGIGMHKKHPSVCLMSSEGSTILNGKALRNLGVLNQFWDGAPYQVDRVDAKDSFMVPDPRLSLSLALQESAFRKYFEKHGDEARGIGFFGRFLISNVVSTQGFRRKHVTDPGRLLGSSSTFQKRVEEMLERILSTHGEINAKTVLRLSPRALTLWEEIFNDIEGELGVMGVLAEMRDFASKMPQHILRLAALFQYFETENAEISAENIFRSSVIVYWYAHQFKYLFSGFAEIEKHSQMLLDWLRTYTRQSPIFGVSKSTLMTHGPFPLRKKAKLDPVLELLLARGQIKKETTNGSKMEKFLLF